MNKLTEGDIQSLVRRYLLQNGFQLFTRTAKGESLHYRTNLVTPPRYKIPDHIAIKNNTVLIFEDKIKYADLFKKGNSDIEKLSCFISNKTNLQDFNQLITKIGVKLTKPSIVPACASLKPENNKKIIPANFVFLGITPTDDKYVIEFCQGTNCSSLFNFDKSALTL